MNKPLYMADNFKKDFYLGVFLNGVKNNAYTNNDWLFY